MTFLVRHSHFSLHKNNIYSNKSQLVKTMQCSAFYKEIQLMLSINEFRLLARLSTIFAVPHVAHWKK